MEDDVFDEINQAVVFEDVCKGRKGAICIDRNNLDHVPLVRSTTAFVNPAQAFVPIINRIIDEIQKHVNYRLHFNNALVELYTQDYKTMGEHTDQMQDLEDESFIALFSCYKRTNANKRMLTVRKKNHDQPPMEIDLTNNSVVIFSTNANKTHKHKIYLPTGHQHTSDWIGVTLRLSKTFLCFTHNVPYFAYTNVPLRLAKDEEKETIYHLRREENNNEDGATYPFLEYTLSPGDLLLPAPATPATL